jgi:heat-inducible transcriptional repressor
VLDERKLTVLRAIVEDYVSTTEPVGSKTLVDRHHFDVSPATIRNDMAVLEEQGFIAQPHTSAGRIPTDKGYRLFVDRLSSVKPLSAAERRAIETFLGGAYSLDDVVMRTVRLLVQLTRQVAVVQYPSLTGTSSSLRSPRPSSCWCSSPTPAGSSSAPSTSRPPGTTPPCRRCARC